MSDLRNLLFVDCETGDLEPETGSIIEIAALLVDPLTLERRSNIFHRYVLPIVPVREGAAKINGYTPDKWAINGAITCAQMFCDLEDTGILIDAIPAGQNPGFDVKFMKYWWNATRGSKPFPKMDYHLIDVANFVVPLWTLGIIPGLSLRHTAPLFDLGEQRHTAVDDMLKALEVFRHTVKNIYEPAVRRFFDKSTNS